MDDEHLNSQRNNYDLLGKRFINSIELSVTTYERSKCMIALKIYLDAYEGKEKDLEKAFLTYFAPAIKTMEGFKNVVMLKKRDALREYEINLFFETEELRMKWVASDEHQMAFPKIAECCTMVSWVSFDAVE